MAVNYDIEKLPLNRGLNIFIILFGNLIAPFWYLFQFYYKIYEKTEFSKLLFLCLAIGVPITTLNHIIRLIFNAYHGVDRKQSDTDRTFAFLAMSSLFTTGMLYAPCLAGYVTKVTPKDAISYSIFMIIGSVVYFVYDSNRRNNKKKKLLSNDSK